MMLKINDDRVDEIIDECRFEKFVKDDIIIYYNGNIKSYIKDDLLLEDIGIEQIINKLYTAFEPNNVASTLLRLNGGYTFIYVNNWNIIYYTCDISAINRIYKFKFNNETYLFDDFQEFLERVNFKNIELDKSNLEYFLEKGYNLPGKTYIKGLTKSIPGYIHYINKENIDIMKFYNYSVKYNYENFKKIFSQNIYMQCKNFKKLYLLLSGGVDSNLILAILNKYKLNITVITGEYLEPYKFDLNYRDVMRSKNIINDIYPKIKHIISSVKIDANVMDILNKYALKMPFESHESIAFYSMFHDIKKDSNEKDSLVLCGQNADTMYLGPTERFTLKFWKKGFKSGLYDLICRFLLSNKYIILSRIPFIGQITRFIIKSILFIARKTWYELPKNEKELIYYFLFSNSYLSAAKNKLKITNNKCDYNLKNYSNVIFLNKIRSFLDGRDSKVVYTSGKLAKIEVFLPYSTQNMIYFFYNMRLDEKFIFKPKEYIYKYCKELGISDKYFDAKINKKISSVASLDKKITKLITNKKEVKSLQYELGMLWINSIKKFFTKCGE